jgi:hypothetical protein
MQIGKAKTSEYYVVLEKMKNDDSRGLRRLYEGNSDNKFQDNLHRRKRWKRQRNMHFGAMKLKHVPQRLILCAWIMEQPGTCA